MIAPGTRLGPYAITAPLGAGGMGEVYKATDTRLDRTVAIKVLPADVGSDGDARARFEREARAVAALDHPHICGIYDVGAVEGTHYLVMPYLDGQSLAARLERGPLPLDQAIEVAAEIADALDKAHRQGITHRDVKPANIMLTKTGAKLLDFGLAKLRGPVAPISMAGVSQLTMQSPKTAQGTILGTVQYMAPEQVEGKEADARTDIWALGAVLYEMVVGRRPFEGDSPASVIGSILKDDPPHPSTQQPLAPSTLDYLVERCLAKDPDERWQSVSDVRHQLQWIGSAATAGGRVSIPTRSPWHERAAWIATTVLLVLLSLFMLWRRPVVPAGDVVRLSVVPPERTVFSGATNVTVPVPQFALSPDGRNLVFAASSAGARPMLWVRPLEEIEAHSLPGTEEAENPFWSPDGRWLGFFADGMLKKTPVAGGPPQVIAGGIPNPLGGSWGPDDTILFTRGNSAVLRVSSAGGSITPVTRLDSSRQEASHRWPRFLPDGRHFLYTVRSALAEHRGVYVASLDGTTTKRLLGVDSSGLYIPLGYLLWLDRDTLLAQAFDTSLLELTGQPFTVAERVGHATTAYAAVSASQTGVLAYAGPIVQFGRLTWFDRTGAQIDLVGPEGNYADFRVSPDATRLAASLVDPRTGTADIWIHDLSRDAALPFTFGPGINASSLWSPDGNRVAFRTNAKGMIELYAKSAAGGDLGQPIFRGEEEGVRGMQTNNVVPSDWSPDGRHLIFSAPTIPTGSFDLWLLPLAGDAKPMTWLQSPSDQMHGNFSPDGRFIAYSSNESGRFEVYVQTFPAAAQKSVVSTSGGYEPRWRADGGEIYYISEDRKLMAVSVRRGPSFGVPQPLFQTRVPGLVTSFRTNYVPSRDGQRFLINTQDADPAPVPITVVLNWQQETQRLVPTN